MGLLTDLLMERVKEHRARQDALNDAQAEIYKRALGTPGLSPESVDYAKEQLQKIYGTKGKTSKDTKGLFDRFGQIVHLVHGHGQQQLGQEGQGGGMPPPPGMQGSKDTSSGMPSPPASMASAGPQDSESVVKGLPPPPAPVKPSPADSFATEMSQRYPSPAQQAEQNASLFEREQGVLHKNKMEEEELNRKITTKSFQAPDGSIFTGFTSPDGKIINSDTQKEVPGAIAATSQMTGPQKLNTDNGGVPTSITRRGKTVTPESPEWDEADQRLWDSGQKAYKEGQANKEKLQTAYGEARAKMFAKYRTVSVMDKETGEPQEVSQWEVVAHPGKYMAAALGQQLKNRATIFDEIDYTKNQLNDAIDKLPDTAFDSGARAQIAYILRADDPRSALDAFMKSGAATTLSPEQVNYVTALASMSESAMSLRSIGGMGAGSDTLRAAIQGMLPDAGTPSKAYARRQMTLFEGEVKQLRRAVPANTSLGLPGPPGTPPRPPKPGMHWQRNKRTNEFREVPDAAPAAATAGR